MPFRSTRPALGGLLISRSVGSGPRFPPLPDDGARAAGVMSAP
jgi:hypothetical protein